MKKVVTGNEPDLYLLEEGWTYTVNGERPSVGCGSCILHDGDKVAWIYTINL